MRKRFNLEKAMEEFEVDKAIAAVKAEDNPTGDSLLEKAEAIVSTDGPEDTETLSETTQVPAEDEDENATDSSIKPDTEEGVAVEEIFKSIRRATLASQALEEISELIENSEETGGLSQTSIPVVTTVINSVYSEVGAEPIVLDSGVSLESISQRANIAKEFLSDIKDKIVAIWKAIVAQLKKVFEFLKQMWQARKHKNEEDLEQLNKLKRAYSIAKSSLKDKPSAEDIRGPLFSALVLDFNQGTFDDVKSSHTKTMGIIDSFLSHSEKAAKASVETASSIKKITISLLDILDQLTDFTVAENRTQEIIDLVLKDAILQTPDYIKYDPGIKGRREIEVKISSDMAGSFVIAYTKPFKIKDTVGLDLVSLKLIDSPIKTGQMDSDAEFSGIFLPKKDQLENLFEITGVTISKSAEILKHMESLEKSFSDFIKLSEDIERQVKAGNRFASKDSHVFASHATEFRKFVNACNSYYINGALNVDNYFYNYKKRMLQYATHSLKAYL